MTFYGVEQNLLQADIYGEGKAVTLLLHGGGQTRHAWRNTAKKLAESGFTAICLDQRGHGDSAWVTSKFYSFWDYGEDVLAVSKQIEAKFNVKPHLIGASLGGIAGLFAAERADFSSLTMVDISPFMHPKGIANVQGFMKEAMKSGFASVEEAADSVARYLPHRPKPRSLEGLKKNLRLRDGRYYWHWDPAFMEGDRTVNYKGAELQASLIEATKRLTLPMLLVRGGSSDIITEDEAKAFMEIAPHAKFVDVAGAGHMVAGDKNDAFSDAILGFTQPLMT